MSQPAPLMAQLQPAQGRRRLLAVWAHPDDESFGPAASFRRAADEGVALALLVATRGEAGEIRLPGVTRAELGQLRERELLAAAGIIGFEQVQILGHPDGGLGALDQLHREVGQAIAAFMPHVIVTFGPDGVTGHLDHQAIGAATTLAFARAQVPTHSDGPWKLYFHMAPPNAQVTPEADHPPALPPTAIVSAPAQRQAKIDALACHRSQIADVQALLTRESELWLTTDHYARIFPLVLPGEAPEDDIMAGV